MARTAFLGALVLALTPGAALAQAWNDTLTDAVVRRAIERRAARQADSTLRDYQVRAHGFVFFLGQLAEGLQEPPRLIKSDELVLEVYWKSPDRSKQRIVGWRDRTDLPTDIRYHRDHLGIVQNNFGDRIRLGEGDEVRDVPHPLAPDGPSLYDYALVDSLTIWLPQKPVRVYEVLVRPRDPGRPRVVGSLFIDVEAAELVVFRFAFTRSAYLDDTLEDITIVLENGLWNERYWLPRRQEIEIRRRTEWLDLPARGIIRGRWEIGDYRFNVDLPEATFRGPEIVTAPKTVRDSFPWETSLGAAITAVAGPPLSFDFQTVRARITTAAGAAALSGLAITRPGVSAASDLLHVNRVEGLTPGFGWVVRPGGGRTEIRARGSYGVSDERPKALLEITRAVGPWAIDFTAGRRVRDVGDEAVISALLNSVLSQELGRDYGDYVLADLAEIGVERRFGAQGGVGLRLGVERTTGMSVAATPASGTYRLNPDLGTGTRAVVRFTAEGRSTGLALQGGVSGSLDLEGGIGDAGEYLRLRGVAQAQVAIAGTRLMARVAGGWGSAGLPPHRVFVMGGRGTLPGEVFRAWGGREAAWGSIEWRVPVPFPEIPLGQAVTTGRRIVLAPFVAAGWTGGAVPDMPWVPSGGARPVVGIGIEWFHRLIRADIGWGLRSGDLTVAVDVSRDLWGIL